MYSFYEDMQRLLDQEINTFNNIGIMKPNINNKSKSQDKINEYREINSNLFQTIIQIIQNGLINKNIFQEYKIIQSQFLEVLNSMYDKKHNFVIPDDGFNAINEVITNYKYILIKIQEDFNIGKIRTIASFFSFTSLDDATTNMNRAILDFKQEGLKEINLQIKEKDIVEDLYSRIVHSNGTKKSLLLHQKPLVDCRHFARLLMELGKVFGHCCVLVSCDASYTKGHHLLIYDQTTQQYKDASIYRTAWNGDKWIPTAKIIDPTNISKQLLKNVKYIS